MAELIYYCGTMDSGKSTLALQTAHNHRSRGREGVIFTSKDRAGKGLISSRLGLQIDALEVDSDLNLHKLIVDDVLATGGTALASVELIEKASLIPTCLVFLLEISQLGGRSRIQAARPGLQIQTILAE